MRRNVLALFGVVLAVVVGARDAHALTACTAAQVIAQDSGCPSGSGPCTITKNFDVATACVLDFGARAVTITSNIDIASGSVVIKAGSLAVSPVGKILGIGDQAAPRNRGGSIRIETTGNVDIQRAGSNLARVEMSANLIPGNIVIVAGGSVTLSGQVVSQRLDDLATGGTIDVTAGGDILTTSGAIISTFGGVQDVGGIIFFQAGGIVDVGSMIDVHGGEGGEFDIIAGGAVTLRQTVDAGANGDAGFGGTVDLTGSRVDLLGDIELDGSGSSIGSGGGDGGSLSVDAEFGDITVARNVLCVGAGPDGSGGSIDFIARGSVVIQSTGFMTVRTDGSEGDGGAIDIEAGVNFSNAAILEASGGTGGGTVDIVTGRDMTLNARLDIAGLNPGSFGGDVFLFAGSLGSGNVTINDRIDVRGGGCSLGLGCGLGGSSDITGCNVTVGTTGNVTARGATGGTNELTARVLLTIRGPVEATRTDVTGVDGSNTFRHPTLIPAVVTGAVTPPAQDLPQTICTSNGQPSCLNPCPTCGNGVVEFPETCDNNIGTPASCDGCSTYCQVENCNDSTPCTNDSCDPGLGCRHQPVPSGTSCSDNNLCNGDEVCGGGICIPGHTLNCNDNNPCTADTCSPTLGCQHTISPGASCNDGNACTVNDSCSASGTCQPGVPRVCDDSQECTTDTCNPASGCVFTPRTGTCTDDGNTCTNDVCGGGVCTHPAKPDTAPCDDGAFCTVNDACTAGSCTSGGARNCADTNGCTADSCDETNDVCVHDPTPLNGTTCSDGLFCNGADTCSGGTCSGHVGNPCAGGPDCQRTCNEAADNCFDPAGTACSDDGRVCTNDACNGSGVCNHPNKPENTPCEDGLFCTVSDVCHGGNCTAGPARNCADTDTCTTDACDESIDTCTHTQPASCCGNGTVEGTEECDDANQSNTDGCLTTCKNATCGDGFVRATVEECDQGAANSDLPNASCRTSCRRQGCGDGVVDNLRGEQCDDSGTSSGDGCSARCFIEPPATAELIGGKGSEATDCALEFAMNQPTHDRNGKPDAKQTCHDGDPACDFGTTAGECEFQVWLCANNQDPNLPACVPGSGGIGNVVGAFVKKPSLKDAKPGDAQNRSQIFAAAAAAQSASGCGPRLRISVPRKTLAGKGAKTIKMLGNTDHNTKDPDSLKLFCVP